MMTRLHRTLPLSLLATLAIACGSASAPAALFTGLELYYNFDNDTVGGGGFDDQSANSRDGSPVDNDAGAGSLGFSGDVPAAIGSGNSLNANGTTDFVRSTWTGITGTTNRTVSMWVKTTDTVGGALAEWGPNTGGNRWSFRLENNSNQPSGGASLIGGIRTEINGDYRTSAVGGPVINDGDWHHVASVFSSNLNRLEDVTMYIDGNPISVSDLASTTGINTTAALGVTVGGGDSAGVRTIDGLFDEVGIWNRALSASEIGQLAAGATIPEPSGIAVLGLAGLGLLLRRRR